MRALSVTFSGPRYAERVLSIPSTRADTRAGLDARRVPRWPLRLAVTLQALSRWISACRASRGWSPQAASNGLEHLGEGAHRKSGRQRYALILVYICVRALLVW
jgi:hypothetical protein